MAKARCGHTLVQTSSHADDAAAGGASGGFVDLKWPGCQPGRAMKQANIKFTYQDYLLLFDERRYEILVQGPSARCLPPTSFTTTRAPANAGIHRRPFRYVHCSEGAALSFLYLNNFHFAIDASLRCSDAISVLAVPLLCLDQKRSLDDTATTRVSLRCGRRCNTQRRP
jgi:hypothetical protein